MPFIKNLVTTPLSRGISESVDTTTLKPEEEKAFFTDIAKTLTKGGLISLEMVDLQRSHTSDGLIHPFIMANVDTLHGDCRGERSVRFSHSPYFCEQVNFDITIKRSSLDAHQTINNNVTLKYGEIIQHQIDLIPSNIITTGFYGESMSESSNPEINKNGEDVKEGWIKKIKTNTPPLEAAPSFSYDEHNKLALTLKKKITDDVRNNTSLICIVGDGFNHDGIDNKELFLVPTKKTLGNLPTYYVKNMPSGHMLITSKGNLKVVAQRNATRFTPLCCSDSGDRLLSLLCISMDYSIADYKQCALAVLTN